MLNLNKIGRPVARIDKGKYNGMLVSVTDQFKIMIKKKMMKSLKNSKACKYQMILNFSRLPIQPKREKFYILPDAVVVVNLLMPGKLLNKLRKVKNGYTRICIFLLTC